MAVKRQNNALAVFMTGNPNTTRFETTNPLCVQYVLRCRGGLHA